MPGFGIGNNPMFRRGGGGSSYDANAQAYFDRITALGQTEPSATQKGRINTLIQDLKTYNSFDNYSEFIRIWPIAGEVKENGFISLVEPESDILTEEGGAPTWTQYQGSVGGSGKYYDTHFVSTTDGGTVYLEDNACMCIYSRTNANNLLPSIGCYTLAPLNISSMYPNYAGAASYTLNDISGNGGAPTGLRTNGFLVVKRNGTTIKFFIDGIEVLSGTSSTTGLVGVSFHIHGRNANNASNEDSDTRQLAVVALGSGDINPWYANYAFEKYMNSMGTGSPLVSDIRLNILVAGQSNNTPMYTIAGNLSAPYLGPLTNVKTGMGAASTNPFVEALQDFEIGENTSAYDAGLGTHYWWGVYMAYKLGTTYNRKVSVTNPSILSTPLADIGVVECWKSDVVGELYDSTRSSYFLPSVYKNNPLAETVMIWNQGNADADDLAAANAYQANLIALIAKWRSPIESGGLGQPNMKVFIVPFYSGYTYTYASTIRAAHDYVIANIPNCYELNIDDADFTVGDEAHWDISFLQTFGERAADLLETTCF